MNGGVKEPSSNSNRFPRRQYLRLSTLPSHSIHIILNMNLSESFLTNYEYHYVYVFYKQRQIWPLSFTLGEKESNLWCFSIFMHLWKIKVISESNVPFEVVIFLKKKFSLVTYLQLSRMYVSSLSRDFLCQFFYFFFKRCGFYRTQSKWNRWNSISNELEWNSVGNSFKPRQKKNVFPFRLVVTATRSSEFRYNNSLRSLIYSPH